MDIDEEESEVKGGDIEDFPRAPLPSPPSSPPLPLPPLFLPPLLPLSFLSLFLCLLAVSLSVSFWSLIQRSLIPRTLESTLSLPTLEQSLAQSSNKSHISFGGSVDRVLFGRAIPRILHGRRLHRNLESRLIALVCRPLYSPLLHSTRQSPWRISRTSWMFCFVPSPLCWMTKPCAKVASINIGRFPVFYFPCHPSSLLPLFCFFTPFSLFPFYLLPLHAQCQKQQFRAQFREEMTFGDPYATLLVGNGSWPTKNVKGTPSVPHQALWDAVKSAHHGVFEFVDEHNSSKVTFPSLLFPFRAHVSSVLPAKRSWYLYRWKGFSNAKPTGRNIRPASASLSALLLAPTSSKNSRTHLVQL